MTAVTPKFVRPRNSERASDPAYWFLRAVQSIVQIGEPPVMPSVPPTVHHIDLRDPHTRAPVLPRAVMAAPSLENRLVVLAQDGRHLVVLGGPKLNFGQSFVLDEGSIAAAAVSNESLFLLISGGELLQIPLFQLVGRISSSPSPPVSLRSLHFVALREVWTPGLGTAPAMACPATPNKDAVLLFDSALEKMVVVEAMGTYLDRRTISLTLSHQLRSTLRFDSGVGLDARVLLFDCKGSRLYLLDPFERQPRLRLVGGDGEPSHRAVGFGAVASDGRLPPANAMTRYNLSTMVIETVASCLRFDFEDPDHRRAVARFLPNQPEEVERLKRQVLAQAGFLVLYDSESGLVATCSLPLQDATIRRLLPAGPPRLLPLAGPQPVAVAPIVDPLAGLTPMLRGLSEVVQGPDSSLMFWRPGDSGAVLLQALGQTFDLLLDNHAHMEELNRLMGRRPQARDSN